jgi:hypothetical protein
VFWPVASDPTVSRLISVLAADTPKALTAIGAARACAPRRGRAPGSHPGHGIDTDIHGDRPDATLSRLRRGHGPNVQAWLWVSPLCARRPRARRHR